MGKHHYRDGEDILPLGENYLSELPETVTVTGVPTQVLYPWRAALRTLFQYVAGLAVTGLIAWLTTTIGVDLSALSGELVGSLTAIMWGLFAMLAARLMAIPAVNNWLARFAPFLATGTPLETVEPWQAIPENAPEIDLPEVLAGE